MVRAKVKGLMLLLTVTGPWMVHWHWIKLHKNAAVTDMQFDELAELHLAPESGFWLFLEDQWHRFDHYFGSPSSEIQFPTRVWLSVAFVERLWFTHSGVLQPCGELPEATHTETKSPPLKVSVCFLGPDSRLAGKVVPGTFSLTVGVAPASDRKAFCWRKSTGFPRRWSYI